MKIPTEQRLRDLWFSDVTHPEDLDFDDLADRGFTHWLASVKAEAVRGYARALDANRHAIPWEKADYLHDLEDWAGNVERGD